MKPLKTLRGSIKEKNLDSFHHHLNDLERVVQNNERMRWLLQEDGTLSCAAFLGSTPVVEALIEKGVGKKYYNENRNMPVETGLILVIKM